MSTKVLTCPWCQASNYADKLAQRHGRCRACSRNVEHGLRLLREQAAAKRQAKTKAAQRAVRKAQQASPEYQALKRGRVLSRAVLQAERRYALGWSRVRVAVDEHDLQSVVSAARALAQANRALARAQRALRLHQAQTPEQQVAAHRAIILPEKEDA